LPSATFALCGFANFASIGIQIGGIGALVPERRHDLARLGHARHAGRHAGELRVGLHRRYPALMATYFDQVHEAADVLAARLGKVPTIAIVLGSGLGAFGDSLDQVTTIPYGTSQLAASRVVGHAGKLVAGVCRGHHVLALSGRAHFYEGHALGTVTFAMRVLGQLGVKTVILTNAAGGINTTFAQAR
jgi:hypothetical protein